MILRGGGELVSCTINYFLLYQAYVVIHSLSTMYKIDNHKNVHKMYMENSIDHIDKNHREEYKNLLETPTP